MLEIHPYQSPAAETIRQHLREDLFDYQIEIAFLINEWCKVHPCEADEETILSMFNALSSNPCLWHQMLGVAPGNNEDRSAGLLLHNFIFSITPSDGSLTDEGCKIIYDHCRSILYNIPVNAYRPNAMELFKAATELRNHEGTGLAVAEFDHALEYGIIDARPACEWAAAHSAEARYIHELTLVLSSCALCSPTKAADNVELCLKLVDEFGDHIYNPTNK